MEAIEALGQHAYLIDDNPTTENLARLVYEQTRAPRLSRRRRHPLGNPRLPRHLRPIPRQHSRQRSGGKQGNRNSNLAGRSNGPLD